jgi:ribonuclease R
LAERATASSKADRAASTGEQRGWEAAGLHCSANERRADEASRDVEAWLKCKYMREHLGEEFSGVVTAATGFGIFVTLDAMYVEGLVHITELGGEYFRFDEARQELRGERTGIRYAIGTRVRVQVSRVDLDGRRIDFRLVHDGQEALLRGGRDRAADGLAPVKPGSARARLREETPSAAPRRGSKKSVLPTLPVAPQQSLKSAVKKAAAKAGRRASKRPRR